MSIREQLDKVDDLLKGLKQEEKAGSLTEEEQKRAYATVLTLSDSMRSITATFNMENVDDVKNIVECINRLEEILRPDNYQYRHKLTVNIKPNRNRPQKLSWFDAFLLGMVEEAQEKAEKKRRRKERINKFLRRG
ncbi:hypothetical protein 278BB001_18 [Bacillus phage 278BB001]|nr:hypothetical protein 278BB001_18 [Bacillus phage 278BB001]